MFDHLVYSIIGAGIFFVLAIVFFVAVLIGNRVWSWI
jgi:hypothetical protein